MKKVSVQIVTYNSAKDIVNCLKGVFEQTHPDLEVLVIDNASLDRTVELISANFPQVNIIENQANIGFAPAHNQGFKIAVGDYVLVLNPDIALTQNYIEELAKAMEQEPQAGMVTGKLLRMTPEGKPTNIIDSTGLIIYKNRRVVDRGQGEEDQGDYQKAEFIFGASGAAPLYRKTMLEDTAVNGEYFDESFFAYKEDVDLSWRAQLLGWKCQYLPKAVAYHGRGWSPGKRKKIPAFLRLHSLKNRYLTLVKNDELVNLLPHLPQLLWYELKVFGYLLFREPETLKVYREFFRLLPAAMQKRRIIMSKRRINSQTIKQWYY